MLENEGNELREIGVRLREARESRHLTYLEISRATKIPIASLEAIENQDVAHLPTGIYMRGFVRAYAAAVGLDAAVIDEYLAQFHTEPPEELAESEPSEGTDYGRANQFWLFVVLVLCLTVGLYATLLRTPARPAATPPPLNIAKTSGELDRVNVAAPASAFAEPAEGMRLQIHLRGACVISATADGRPVYSRLAQRGETVRVDGRDEVTLSVTDPGSCAYSIDGTSRQRRGKPDDTVTIRMAGAAAGKVITGAGLRAGAAEAAVSKPKSGARPSAPEPANPTEAASPTEPANPPEPASPTDGATPEKPPQ
jgi:cytoskeleton protein RodZ